MELLWSSGLKRNRRNPAASVIARVKLSRNHELCLDKLGQSLLKVGHNSTFARTEIIRSTVHRSRYLVELYYRSRRRIGNRLCKIRLRLLEIARAANYFTISALAAKDSARVFSSLSLDRDKTCFAAVQWPIPPVKIRRTRSPPRLR